MSTLKIQYWRCIPLKEIETADISAHWQAASLVWWSWIPAASAAISRSSLSSASAWAASWALRFWKTRREIVVTVTRLQVWGQSYDSLTQTCGHVNRIEYNNLLQCLYWSKIFGPPVQHSFIRLIFFLCSSLLFLLLLLFLLVALLLSLLKDTWVILCSSAFYSQWGTS